MGHVIHVDFSKNNIEQTVCDCKNIDAYLNYLRTQGIEEDDVLDTLDAINDMNMYFAADSEVQKFADGWLHQFM